GSSGIAVGLLGIVMGSLGMAAGSLGIAVGSLGIVMGSSGIAVGSLGIAVGSSGIALGSLGMPWDSVGMLLQPQPDSLPTPRNPPGAGNRDQLHPGYPQGSFASKFQQNLRIRPQKPHKTLSFFHIFFFYRRGRRMNIN
uniref:Uncharacterized protein n=1 Tax=Cyanistes caeruleus TaxID=156563 RepID=A0A8C0U021_CYACU